MSVQTGARLGPYEIVGKLGEGGMGEVYRARDRRLNRDVAIKILPAAFAADAERLARFEREAQTLAVLNHPNIAQIHGVIDLPHDGGSGPALVMECVEGEDLSQRLARGPIPADEALHIARQIAEALEAAHERGIVHRDLKPANVKVAPDGTVKVLDFGLAVGVAPAGPQDLANSPTFTSPAVMTQSGVILGTAAYMSPEQARGKVVDRRADIWAFGCVLYEMLCGARPFAGESLTDVLSAIVSRDPDWTRLPANTPEAIRGLLKRCLEKDPRRRLRDVGEARVLLEQRPDAATDAAVSPATSSPSTRRLVAVLSTLIAVLALAVLYLAARPAPAHEARVVTRYEVPLPGNATVSVVFRPAVSVSADGSAFAFTGTSEGIDRLYVRGRGDAAARVIPGTDRGTSPALAPDGRTIVFFADGALRKASIDGGASIVAAAHNLRGVTWADASTLIVAPDSGGPLVRVPAGGGEVRAVTTIAKGERTHRWPDALPGGTAVLFTVGTLDKPDTYDQGNIDLVILATGERRGVIKGAAMARYCGPGRLVYSKGTSLYAVPFDVGRLEVTGSAVEVVQGVERDASTGAAHFDCSDDGVLAYVPGSAAGDARQLTWMDRDGKTGAVALAPGPYQEASLSPDGGRVALLKGSTGAGDVWIYDLATGTVTRLTFNGTCAAPLWSADGRYVYYTAIQPSGTASVLTRKIADGSRDAEVLRPVEGRAYLGQINDVAGTFIVTAVNAASDQGDIMRVPLAASMAPQPIAATPANEYGASVSPDGRWLAYQSDETGRPEIYAVDLKATAVRQQVTSSGGEEPRWSRDGRELYYRTANRLMAVAIDNGRAGNPRPLFDGIYNAGIESGRSYDVDLKTGRFILVVRARDRGPAGSVRVVVNWDAALGAR